MDFDMIVKFTLEPLEWIALFSVETYVIIRVVLIILKKIHNSRKIREKRRLMDSLVSESFVVGAETFLDNTDLYENYVGIYVIYNKSQDLYYVGQATRTVDRLKSHLTGHGNGDVYADFKYGDKMFISVIPYDLSQGSLNDMEASFIDYYDACNHGYNKTKGNHH